MALRPRGSRFTTQLSDEERALQKAEQMRIDADREVIAKVQQMPLDALKRELQNNPSLSADYDAALARQRERRY